MLSGDLKIFWYIVLLGNLIDELLGKIAFLSRKQADRSLIRPRKILLSLVTCGNNANFHCHSELRPTCCVHHQLHGGKVDINWRCYILSEVDLSSNSRIIIGEKIRNRAT